MTPDEPERAPREVLRMLLPENQIVAVIDDHGSVVGQLRVATCSGIDVEVRIQRGELGDGPVNIRVGGAGVAWDLQGLLIRTSGAEALLANVVLLRRVQQRAWARVTLESEIDVVDDAEHRWALDGIDLSAGGLAAHSHEPPPRRGLATFTVHTAPTTSQLSLSVEVVRARCHPDGRWRVAYRFDRVDPATHNRLVTLVSRLATQNKEAIN